MMEEIARTSGRRAIDNIVGANNMNTIKKSRFAILILFFVVCSYAYSQDEINGKFSAGVYDGYIDFNNNKVEFLPFFNDLPQNIIEGEYNYRIIDNIPFLEILSEPYINMIFLYDKYFCLLTMQNFRGEGFYVDKSEISNIIESSLIGRHELLFINYAAKYDATSYLVEGDTEYLPENLKHASITGPWVEGVHGAGIGEKVEINFILDKNGNPDDYWNGFPVNGLLLSNGFLSTKNPSLYKKNNRIKKIEIMDINENFSIDAELRDTPELQLIILPEYTDKIIIEIKEVYPGDKWDDTCLNLLLGLRGVKNVRLE